MQFSSQILQIMIGWHNPVWDWQPSGKSWIRHCISIWCSFQVSKHERIQSGTFTCLLDLLVYTLHQNKQDNPGLAKRRVSFITSLNLFLVTNPPCFHIMSKHTVCKQLVLNLLVWNNRDKPTISSIESTTGSLQFIYSRYWTFSTESDTMDNLQSLHCEHAPLKICNHIVWISLKEYIDLNQSQSNSTSKA